MIFIYVCLALVVILTALGWTLLLTRHHQASSAELQLQRQIRTLQAEIRTVNNAATGVGQRLISVEKKLNAAIAKQQHLEVNGSNLMPVLSGPVSAEQLIERYGFSEVEARLISRLVAVDPEHQR